MGPQEAEVLDTHHSPHTHLSIGVSSRRGLKATSQTRSSRASPRGCLREPGLGGRLPPGQGDPRPTRPCRTWCWGPGPGLAGSGVGSPGGCSIAQSCPTPGDPVDCTPPGLRVHHRLPGWGHQLKQAGAQAGLTKRKEACEKTQRQRDFISLRRRKGFFWLAASSPTRPL